MSGKELEEIKKELLELRLLYKEFIEALTAEGEKQIEKAALAEESKT
ncbi:MAG: hypothetical protein QW717_01415 [Candidatus Bathyarchaeia archaeon]